MRLSAVRKHAGFVRVGTNTQDNESAQRAANATLTTIRALYVVICVMLALLVFVGALLLHEASEPCGLGMEETSSEWWHRGWWRVCSCGPGRFASDTDANECTQCVAGKFASDTGSGSCADCGVGRFASDTGASSCTDCAAGHFASNTGTSSCTDCAAGRFASHTGASSCADCAAGTVATSVGSEQCSMCPSLKWTPTVMSNDPNVGKKCYDCTSAEEQVGAPIFGTFTYAPGQARCNRLGNMWQRLYVEVAGAMFVDETSGTACTTPPYLNNVCTDPYSRFWTIDVGDSNTFQLGGVPENDAVAPTCNLNTGLNCGSTGDRYVVLYDYSTPLHITYPDWHSVYVTVHTSKPLNATECPNFPGSCN